MRLSHSRDKLQPLSVQQLLSPGHLEADEWRRGGRARQCNEDIRAAMGSLLGILHETMGVAAGSGSGDVANSVVTYRHQPGVGEA